MVAASVITLNQKKTIKKLMLLAPNPYNSPRQASVITSPENAKDL